MLNLPLFDKMEQNELKTALLVMDMQQGIVRNLPDAAALLPKVADAIATARARNLLIVFVRVGFRVGAPEISKQNKIFASGNRDRLSAEEIESWMAIHPDLPLQERDILVTKRRISAFTGSDLEVVLRAQNIQHLVLCGIATSGVVLSTLREAADKDYALSVLADCCGDADEEVHRVLTTKVFPRQAAVLTLEEWAQ
jgi:nicotinamidase-related amidase